MLGEHVEAVYENGVFRPLKPVRLPERQRVTLVVPTEEDVSDQEASCQPLPLRDCKTIRVRFKRGEDFGPLPYPVELDDLEEQ